ncbi:MAG: YjcQ family protein [Bacillota bacterium]
MNKKELLYKILSDFDQGKAPKAQDYDVDLQLFGDVLEIANDEGFLKNARVVRGGQGNKVVGVFAESAKITLSGLNYLEKNIEIKAP